MRSAGHIIIGAACVAIAGCIPDEPPAPQADTAAQAETPTAPSAPDAGAGHAEQPTETAEGMSASQLLAHVEKMREQVKNRPRGFDINLLLGNLYYGNDKYIDAIEFFSDALSIAEPTEKVLLASGPAKGTVPRACRQKHLTPEQIRAGEEMVPYEDIVKAAAALPDPDRSLCLEQFRNSIADVHARRGSAWYLIGNPDNAQADHAAALKLDPDNPEALFFTGAAIMETSHGNPEQLEKGKAYWEHLLKVAPDHPRADFVRQTLPKVGDMFGPHPETAMAGHPAMAGPGPLPPGAEEMQANFQHTPENEAELDRITEHGEQLLKEAKWGDALNEFKRVMPVRPSGRIAMDMGIALRERGDPKAEMVLTQATRMPGGDPQRAKYELAVFYEKHNPAQARAIYAELQDDPKVGEDAKVRLSKLSP